MLDYNRRPSFADRVNATVDQALTAVADDLTAALDPDQHARLLAELSDEALRAIIRDYTREAGVRSLERQIGSVFRSVALRVAEDPATRERIEPDRLASILGHHRFEREMAMRTSLPGVVTGLAWTPVGGELLFIEASSTPGGGRLVLTGQLGDVMKESARAAWTYARSHAESLGIAPECFERDLHVHVPAGAIPKDGPSAGVTMATALVSLLTSVASMNLGVSKHTPSLTR